LSSLFIAPIAIDGAVGSIFFLGGIKGKLGDIAVALGALDPESGNVLKIGTGTI